MHTRISSFCSVVLQVENNSTLKFSSIYASIFISWVGTQGEGRCPSPLLSISATRRWITCQLHVLLMPQLKLSFRMARRGLVSGRSCTHTLALVVRMKFYFHRFIITTRISIEYLIWRLNPESFKMHDVLIRSYEFSPCVSSTDDTATVLQETFLQNNLSKDFDLMKQSMSGACHSLPRYCYMSSASENSPDPGMQQTQSQKLSQFSFHIFPRIHFVYQYQRRLKCGWAVKQ